MACSTWQKVCRVRVHGGFLLDDKWSIFCLFIQVYDQVVSITSMLLDTQFIAKRFKMAKEWRIVRFFRAIWWRSVVLLEFRVVMIKRLSSFMRHVSHLFARIKDWGHRWIFCWRVVVSLLGEILCVDTDGRKDSIAMVFAGAASKI